MTLDKLAAAVTKWELNRTSPAPRFVPSLIGLIGFDPSPPGASLGERLKATRRWGGYPQDRFARQLGIDPSTLSRSERGPRDPTGRQAQLAEAFLERLARRRSIVTDIAGQLSTTNSRLLLAPPSALRRDAPGGGSRRVPLPVAGAHRCPNQQLV